MRKLSAATVAIASFTIVAVGCGVDSKPSNEDKQRLNDNANVTTSASPTIKPTGDGSFGAGDYELGKKQDLKSNVITSGTYIITTPKDGINCYWETVNNFDHSAESIIANGNIDPGANARVVVKNSYAGLRLDGDCLAKKKG